MATMDDGVDQVVTLSVYDTEANALAANELAAEFVSEYMTDWISEAPTRINGSMAVAAFTELNEGANLVDETRMDSKVFASVRVYDGVDPDDQDEIARLTAAGFLPIMRESAGFVGYYLLPAGDRLASVSLFDSAGQAAASNEKARDFVAENLAPLLPNAPMIVEGSLDLWLLAADEDGMQDESTGALYASLRIYGNRDLAEREKQVNLAETIFLPQQQELDGLFSYSTMDDGVDRVVTLSVFDTEANALAANELAAEFAAEYMSEWGSEAPTRINGSMAVAAFAELNEGANLVDDAKMASKVFASIRIYDGIDPADQAEIARITREGFLPINSAQATASSPTICCRPAKCWRRVNLFDSPEQAAASNEKAREFVAENYAPLLPNPPMIVEGTVDVCTQLMSNVVEPGDLSMPLHARLVIYDGFDMARLDETVALVDSVLLPKLRDAGGLFSYYCISDRADTAAALRVMDSAESLQRGTDIAAEFISDYMAGWLPEDPLVLDGRLGVAAVGAILEGANLVEQAEDQTGVFASVRVYDGIEPSDQGEIARVTNEGFLPIMRASDGFVGYYFLTAEDMLATVSLFDSPEQASASADEARAYVAENLAPLLPNAPTIYEGELSINHVAALSDGKLYSSIRFYSGFDLSHFDEANDLAIAHLLPALQDLGGLFAQYALNDGVDTVVGISVFTSEEAALAANEVGKAFTRDYLADWAPSPPTGVSGKLAIAALAGVNAGENLVGEMME